MLEGSLALLVLLILLVTGTQLFYWAKASREAEALVEQLNRLRVGD
jgi:hypothetical protein